MFPYFENLKRDNDEDCYPDFSGLVEINKILCPVISTSEGRLGVLVVICMVTGGDMRQAKQCV
jgi:hypothetical protein